MPTICGIDPGFKTGGVALYNKDLDWYEVHDLPVYDQGGVDVLALADILNSDHVTHIYIEKQSSRPKQGVSSAFKIGYAYGQLLSMAMLWESTPYTVVTPAKWKTDLRLGREKDEARQRAQQWFPKVSKDLIRKKDEHRAEALLLAKWGSMQS